MPTYKYSVTRKDYRSVGGEIDANSYAEAVRMVEAAYPDHNPGSISVKEKESTTKKVAEGAAVGAGCLAFGALQLVIAALPIALAIIIAFWVLRGCYGK